MLEKYKVIRFDGEYYVAIIYRERSGVHNKDTIVKKHTLRVVKKDGGEMYFLWNKKRIRVNEDIEFIKQEV